MEEQIFIRQCISPRHRREDDIGWTYERSSTHEYVDHWMYDDFLSVRDSRKYYLFLYFLLFGCRLTFPMVNIKFWKTQFKTTIMNTYFCKDRFFYLYHWQPVCFFYFVISILTRQVVYHILSANEYKENRGQGSRSVIIIVIILTAYIVKAFPVEFLNCKCEIGIYEI